MTSFYIFVLSLLLFLIQPNFTYGQTGSTQSKILSLKSYNKPIDKQDILVLNPEDSSKLRILERLSNKNQGYVYIPPPGIDYKIEKFRPDSSIDYKIQFHRCIPKNNPLGILKNFNKNTVPPDLLKKHLKKLIPQHFLH